MKIEIPTFDKEHSPAIGLRICDNFPIFIIIIIFIPSIFLVGFASANTEPEMEWNKTYGTIFTDTGYSVQQTSDGGYIIAGAKGNSKASQGGDDAYLIKTYQNGTEKWSEIFVGNGLNQARSVQQTSDGGYIIAGYTYLSSGTTEVQLIKTYSDGTEEWNRILGGDYYDEGYSVQQTSEGGYIITGRTLSYGGLYLLKTYPDGNEEWNKTYKNKDIYIGYDVKQTLDGGYIIAGGSPFADNPMYILKTDSSGNEEWHEFLGSGSGDAKSVLQIDENNFIVAGYSSSSGAGSADFYLAKLKIDYTPVFSLGKISDSFYSTSPNVYVEWEKTYGGTESETAYDVEQTSDGGYVLVGYTESYGSGLTDVFVVKTDSDGNEIWNKTIGGTDWDYGYSIDVTLDGGYIITGATESFGYGEDSDNLYDSDVWLIKLEVDGDLKPSSPEITSVNINPPTCINEDETATISVTASNNGGFSSEGYITVSFPNDETVSRVSGTGDSNKLYPKGSEIWGKDGKIPSSENALVELLKYNWDGGKEQTLTLAVTPNSGSNEIVFYVRAALKNDTDGTYIRNPVSSDFIDQQGWNAYRYSVDTCNIYPNLIITDIYTNENEKQISYKIKNIGGITAGPSYSYLYIDNINVDDITARVASDYVDSLQSNEERTLFFDYSYTCSGDSDTIKVCADGKSEVNEATDDDNCKTIIKQCSINPESLIVNILDPADSFSVVQGVGETVKAKVTDNFGNTIPGSSISLVKATFSNGDEDLILFDDGVHGDGGANDGIYANEWVPTTVSDKYFETACTIKVIAQHSALGLADDEVKGIINSPDLIVQDISWNQPNSEQGDSITFTITIKNQGSGSIGAGSEVEYYIDDSYIESDSIPNLAAEETSTQTFTWTSDRCENIQIEVVINTNNVYENNKTNNRQNKIINIKCPISDIFIQDIDWEPYDLVAGVPITIKITIINIGREKYISSGEVLFDIQAIDEDNLIYGSAITERKKIFLNIGDLEYGERKTLEVNDFTFYIPHLAESLEVEMHDVGDGNIFNNFQSVNIPQVGHNPDDFYDCFANTIFICLKTPIRRMHVKTAETALELAELTFNGGLNFKKLADDLRYGNYNEFIFDLGVYDAKIISNLNWDEVIKNDPKKLKNMQSLSAGIMFLDILKTGFTCANVFQFYVDILENYIAGLKQEGISLSGVVGASPIYILIEDENGNESGYNQSGIKKEEINGSLVFTSDHYKTILIPGKMDNKKVKVFGYDKEVVESSKTFFSTMESESNFSSFNLSIIESSKTIIFENVPVTPETVGIIEIKSTNPGYDLDLDYDGDGTKDDTVKPSLIKITEQKDETATGSRSSHSSSGGGGSGGGTSGEAFANILISETERENVYKDTEISYSFDMEGNIVRYINFTGLTSYGQIVAKVEILNHTSTLVDHAPQDEVYKNLNLWLGNLGWATSRNIANPTVNFMVEKSWVTENKIDESTIRLNRYSDGTWNPLDTARMSSDSSYLYFETETPGFSPFAITGKKVLLPAAPGGEGIEAAPTTFTEESLNQTATEKKPGVPGFELIASLSILLIAFEILRRRK